MPVKPRYNKMRPCEGGKWLMDVITDYGTFLREAKTAVLELRDMQQQEQQLLKRLKQDQKQLETDKKAVEDRISPRKNVWARSQPATIKNWARARIS